MYTDILTNLFVFFVPQIMSLLAKKLAARRQQQDLKWEYVSISNVPGLKMIEIAKVGYQQTTFERKKKGNRSHSLRTVLRMELR